MDMRKGDDLMGKNVGELSEIDLKNLIEEYYMGVKTDELIKHTGKSPTKYREEMQNT